MNQGQTLFAQVMAFAPHLDFQRCVQRYGGDQRVRRFHCWDHFPVMAFGQLSFRESLRDIEACLKARAEKLYHMGIRSKVAAQHAGRGQREAGLEDLRRFRAGSDSGSPAALLGRELRCGTAWAPRIPPFWYRSDPSEVRPAPGGGGATAAPPWR
ncbi:MAG: DUF4372 domain-containing protein [Gemmatimonadetes bacterium]|nr:DUF4372 domain-containing protein [Gemmatimonadota bacterium]